MRSDNVIRGSGGPPTEKLILRTGLHPELERPLIGVVSAYSRSCPAT